MPAGRDPMSKAGSDGQKKTEKRTDELKEVIDAERRYVAERRKALGLQPGTVPDDLVGLALSGGGIRSATFNLGFLQGLAKHQVLRHVDYLSTVSGGGYIGSCLTSLLHPHAAGERRAESAENNQRKTEPSMNVDSFPFRFTDEQSGNERPELKHLRRYGTYLMPSGRLFSLDFWRLIGMYLTGVVTNNLVPFAIILVLAFLFKSFIAVLIEANVPMYGYWTAGGLFLVAVVVRAVAAAFDLSHRSRKIRGNLVATLVSMSAIAVVLSGVVDLLVQQASLPERLAALEAVKALGDTATVFDLVKIVLDALLGASLLGLTAGLAKSEGKRLRPVLEWVFKASRVALIPLLLLQALIWLSGTSWIDQPVVPLVALIMGGASFFINPNRTSMHHFYRDRLSTAYIIKTNEEGGIDSNEELDLADLYPKSGKSGAPYHLINATLNVPSTLNVDLRGRGAAPFLYSAFYCGSEPTGYRKTELYTNYGDTRLATAMAVSGAATSPQMGSGSRPAQTFLMTLLNLRLNRWVPNPKYTYRLFGRIRYWARLWPLYFFYELLSKGTEKGRLLNLSDGGHFENLGIYTLLQRRCRFIIASDASMDKNFQFHNLSDLVRRARVDLGIDLKIRRNGLTPVDGSTPMYHMTAEIEYPGKSKPGILIYAKTSTQGNEPLDLVDYKRRTEFPDESTSDQFFDEPQFESYRKLGELAANEICASGGETDEGSIEAFFKKAHAHYQEHCEPKS